MTLTGDQLAFMARLSKSPEGKFLVSLYEANLAELDAALRKADGDDIYRLQGRASQVEEMIDHILGSERKANPKPITRFVNASRGFGDS